MSFSNRRTDSGAIESQATSSKKAGRAGLAVALVAALAIGAIGSNGAVAQPVGRAVVDVTPLVADIGVPRQIRVSGTWAHACVPLSATLVEGGSGDADQLTVRLNVPQTLVACAQVLTPYSQVVSYTPSVRGKKRIAAVTNDGQYLGDGSLATRGPDDVTSLADITGMWYDPATNGSGLTFIHNGTSTVFGTWYLYDSQGNARWYTIQNVQWLQQGRVFEGTIYETTGHGVVCPPPFVACPVAFASATPRALARFTLNSATSARIEALAGNGSVLFSSNLVRAGI